VLSENQNTGGSRKRRRRRLLPRWQREKMFESFKRHPVFSIAQLIAAVLVLPAFFCTVSFLAADTAVEVARGGKPLPGGWSAGVMSHGTYYRWWTIAERPIFFGLSVAVLATTLIMFYSTLYVDWKDRQTNK
jgi:hypothetical protein